MYSIDLMTASVKQTLRFDGGEMSFRDYTGRVMKLARTSEGAYVVPVSGDPVFFEGGALWNTMGSR